MKTYSISIQMKVEPPPPIRYCTSCGQRFPGQKEQPSEPPRFKPGPVFHDRNAAEMALANLLSNPNIESASISVFTENE